MKEYCKEDLRRLKKLLLKLSEQQYYYQSKLLTGATIGQHTRHILEFYLCLIKGVKDNKTVNYDSRERDLELENNLSFAVFTIDKICSNINLSQTTAPFHLQGNYDTGRENKISIPSSIERELAYCLEHSIHHQALIKIALIELQAENLIDETFGVAPATIRFRNEQFLSAN